MVLSKFINFQNFRIVNHFLRFFSLSNFKNSLLCTSISLDSIVYYIFPLFFNVCFTKFCYLNIGTLYFVNLLQCFGSFHYTKLFALIFFNSIFNFITLLLWLIYGFLRTFCLELPLPQISRFLTLGGVHRVWLESVPSCEFDGPVFPYLTSVGRHFSYENCMLLAEIFVQVGVVIWLFWLVFTWDTGTRGGISPSVGLEIRSVAHFYHDRILSHRKRVRLRFAHVEI